MASWLLLLPRLVVYTAAAGLRVDPDDPPERDVGRAADGSVRLRFPGAEDWLEARGAAVVSLAPGASAPAALRAEGRPLGRAERHWVVPVRPGEDALDVALRWARADGVAAAIPDLLLDPRPAGFDDPEYLGQWYLENLGMEALYTETLGDRSVRVAVIDGAVDVTHPDLAPAVIAPRDVVDGDDDPSPVPGDECPDGVVDEVCDTHGTAVAGLTSAGADNGVGIVGLCPGCSLIPIRLLGDGAPLSAEIAAFEHAIEQDAAVINNSWGYTRATPASDALIEVVSRAVSEPRGGLGAVVVFAAGNDDRELRDDEMVALPGVLCVSALDRYGLPVPYTNFGPAVDLAAPSATVSLAPGGGTTDSFGGTSAAAPVVAGVAGWILSYAPELSAEEVVELMVETAHESSQVTFDASGHHDVYGYGELDPPTILAALDGTWPPQVADPVAPGDAPGGCGCSGTGAAAGWLAPLALLAMRRRR